MDTRTSTSIDESCPLEAQMASLPLEINAGILTFLKLPPTVKSIVTVVAIKGHCVVLQLKLQPHNTTVVYDFKASRTNDDLKQWAEHEEYVMKRCGISKTGPGPQWLLRYYDWTKDTRRKIQVEQTEGSDSGPVACRILWELLCPGAADELFGELPIMEGNKKAKKVLDDDVETWRKTCIDELKTMVEQYREEKNNRKRKNPRVGNKLDNTNDDESRKPEAKRLFMIHGSEVM